MQITREENSISSMTIHREMTVGEVITRHPEKAAIFMKHGCPDMRQGFFAVMANFMKIKWAAFVHRIDVEQLESELNEVRP